MRRKSLKKCKRNKTKKRNRKVTRRWKGGMKKAFDGKAEFNEKTGSPRKKPRANRLIPEAQEALDHFKEFYEELKFADEEMGKMYPFKGSIFKTNSFHATQGWARQYLSDMKEAGGAVGGDEMVDDDFDHDDGGGKVGGDDDGAGGGEVGGDDDGAGDIDRGGGAVGDDGDDGDDIGGGEGFGDDAYDLRVNFGADDFNEIDESSLGRVQNVITIGNIRDEEFDKLTVLPLLSLEIRLTNHIPESLYNLTSLNKLKLEMLQVQKLSPFPESICSLTNLEELLISFSNFECNVPASISACRNLISLDIGWNRFTGSLPASISSLVNLENLNISWNYFTGSFPASISSLVNLEKLNISRNMFTGSLPASISSLVNLRNFSIENNNFTGNLPESIGNLTNLESLFLSKNLFTGGLPESMSNLTNLIQFGCSENGFTGNIPEWIGNLLHIQLIFIDRNQFSGALPHWIRSKVLDNLSFDRSNLTIGYNQFTLDDYINFFAPLGDNFEDIPLTDADDFLNLDYYFELFCNDEGSKRGVMRILSEDPEFGKGRVYDIQQALLCIKTLWEEAADPLM